MCDVFSPGSGTYYFSCILCTSHKYTNTTWKYHSIFFSLLNFSLDHKNHCHHFFQDFNLLNATFYRIPQGLFIWKNTINSRAPFEMILLYLNCSVYTLIIQRHLSSLQMNRSLTYPTTKWDHFSQYNVFTESAVPSFIKGVPKVKLNSHINSWHKWNNGATQWNFLFLQFQCIWS